MDVANNCCKKKLVIKKQTDKTVKECRSEDVFRSLIYFQASSDIQSSKNQNDSSLCCSAE